MQPLHPHSMIALVSLSQQYGQVKAQRTKGLKTSGTVGHEKFKLLDKQPHKYAYSQGSTKSSLLAYLPADGGYQPW